jgi:hypothetical protein
MGIFRRLADYFAAEHNHLDLGENIKVTAKLAAIATPTP